MRSRMSSRNERKRPERFSMTTLSSWPSCFGWSSIRASSSSSGLGAELDDGLGALDGLEVDVPARDPNVELERARGVERLAPHRFLRGRAGFAGR